MRVLLTFNGRFAEPIDDASGRQFQQPIQR